MSKQICFWNIFKIVLWILILSRPQVLTLLKMQNSQDEKVGFSEEDTQLVLFSSMLKGGM